MTTQAWEGITDFELATLRYLDMDDVSLRREYAVRTRDYKSALKMKIDKIVTALMNLDREKFGK